MAKIYEAMQKDNRSDSSGSSYFNLRNRKQISDLAKIISRYSKKETACKVFNFTSCGRSEGVTTVIANLSSYLKSQQLGKKILLIDANFYNPSLHKVFGTANKQGLTDCLKDGENSSSYVISTKHDDVDLLPCGGDFRHEAGNICQEKFEDVIAENRNLYDFIIIDSSAILSSADGLSTAVAADVTFLILQAFKVQREAVLKAKTYLHDSECVVGGVILNRVLQVIPGWMYRVI